MHHVRIIGPLLSLKTVGSSSGMVFGIWCLPGVKVGSCDAGYFQAGDEH